MYSPYASSIFPISLPPITFVSLFSGAQDIDQVFIWSNLIRRYMLLHRRVYTNKLGFSQDTVLIRGYLSFSDARPFFFTGTGLIMGTVLYSGYYGDTKGWWCCNHSGRLEVS